MASHEDILLLVREIFTVFTLFYHIQSYNEAKEVKKLPLAFICFVAWAVLQLLTRTFIIFEINIGLQSILLTVTAFLQTLGAYFLYKIMRAEL